MTHLLLSSSSISPVSHAIIAALLSSPLFEFARSSCLLLAHPPNSVGGAAASEDMLLRGSGSEKSDSSRQLKSVNAKGKPTVINWRCKDSTFDGCALFKAGRSGNDTCQQCCECDCDGDTVTFEEKCMELKKEDATTGVSCTDQGAIDVGTGCTNACETYCTTRI